MNKKFRLLIFVFLINNIATFGQERFLFLNQHIIYEKYEKGVRDGESIQQNNNSTLFEKGIISITYSKLKDHSFTEYTFMPFHIRNDNYSGYNKQGYMIDGYTLFEISSNLTFSFSYIFKDNSKKFRPYLGVGTGFFFKYQDYMPNIAIHFPRIFTKYSFRAFLNIGFKYKIYNRLFLNFQIPFNILDYNILYDKILNPTIDINDRTVKYDTFSFLPSLYLLKIGIGFKISKSE